MAFLPRLSALRVSRHSSAAAYTDQNPRRQYGHFASAQQITRAANLHVAHGDGVTGPKMGLLGNRFQSCLGIRIQATPGAVEEIRIRSRVLCLANSATQLVQLRQYQMFRLIDNQRIGIWEIQTTFNNRRTDQNINLTSAKSSIILLQLRSPIWPCPPLPVLPAPDAEFVYAQYRSTAPGYAQ